MANSRWQQTLIDQMVSDVQPVRRLWRPEVRLLVWLALAMPAVCLPAAWVLRDDVASRLRAPAFVLEEGAMLIGAALLGLGALRGAVPGRRTGRVLVGITAVALAIVAAVLASKPIHTGWTMDTFFEIGRPCLWRSLSWSAVPWALLFVAVRRGIPLEPIRAGALIGAAACGVTLVALRLCCQTEELLHLSVFHVLPLLLVALISAALGSVLLKPRYAP